ncbi:tripartite motif-containing protein 45-like [Anneissia japonica]|uniref:tripartite motif-containing protein 45-like n=1 Tax=Anneissia japonica TaxID=1529436 RepID=UPI00142584AA|nr:tripartite motif-containing protein 45-like [Anneissia japonica]
MASIVQGIDAFVSCPICKEHYDEDIRRPKILVCTHSFCIVCIRELIRRCYNARENTFRCPTCRYEHIPPAQGTDASAYYTDNNDLLGLKDLLENQYRQRDESQVQKCELCREPSNFNEAVAWCESCSKALCKICCERHDDLPIKGHPKSTPLNEVNFHEIDRKDYCQVKDHKGEEITLVCYQHEITEFLCNVCAQDSCHQHHDVKDLKTEAKNKLSEINKLFNMAEKINHSDLDCKQMLEVAKDTLERNLNAAQSHINECQDHFMEALQKHGENNQQKLCEIKEEKSDLLSKEIEENKQRCCRFENITNEVDQFHLASPRTIVEDTNNLTDALIKYKNMKEVKAPTANVYVDVKCGVDTDDKFEQFLQESRQIRTMPSELRICHPKLAFRDFKFKLQIQTILDNEICKVGGLPVRVSVHCPCCRADKTLVPHYKCGNYLVTYLPKSIGEYTFDIYIEGSEKPTAKVCVSVHLLELFYEKIVHCGEVCTLRAHFAAIDIATRLNVICQNEVGDILEPVDVTVSSQELNAAVQPNYLGKLKMYVTFDNIKIAGPFTIAVYKKPNWNTNSLADSEITHLAVSDRCVYFADTQVNKKILAVNPMKGPNMYAVDNFQKKGMSFLAFDDVGKKFVLFITVLKDALSAGEKIETKTELKICTRNGRKSSYILKSVKNPAGIAVNTSGEIAAVSDRKEHCIFIFHTPESDELITSIDPVRKLGEEGERLGTFNNPTALCINKKNKLFVLDSGNGRVQELNMDGEFVDVYGPEILRLQAPESICLSPEGYLLILDTNNLVTIDVNSGHRKTIHQVAICCEGQSCNFNHLICSLSDCQVLRFCIGKNAMHIFRYLPIEKK